MLAEPNVGGWGGSALGDGASALIATTDGDTYNFPVEVVESRFPVLVERYALNVEAGGGAGRHRGGFGVVREYRVHGASEASGYGSIGGFGRVPWALGGGSPGTENFLDYTTPRSARPPRPRAARAAGRRRRRQLRHRHRRRLRRSARARARARARGRPRRLRDRSSEARTVYGVALDPESLELDAAETARLRAR